MAHYLIGDLQGCDAPLGRLLDKVGFSASRDTVWVLGDLVNRGPASAAVLRRLMGYGDAAHCLLGNHDLSLLAVAHGHRAPHRNDTMDDILLAPDRAALLEWLRHRSLAQQGARHPAGPRRRAAAVERAEGPGIGGRGGGGAARPGAGRLPGDHVGQPA